MPIIKPISDLRDRANELSRICHEEDQPIFITKNGQGDLVVMSHTHYERLQANWSYTGGPSGQESQRNWPSGNDSAPAGPPAVTTPFEVRYLLIGRTVQVRCMIRGARRYDFLLPDR